MRLVRIVSFVSAVALASVLSVGQASADSINVDSLLILKNVSYENGVLSSTNPYQFQVQLTGTGITSANLQVIGGSVNLTNNGGVWSYNKNDFASQLDLDAYWANTMNTKWLTLNGGADYFIPQYSAAPPSAVPAITNPLSNAIGVALNPNYQWNSLSGTCDALHLQVRDGADNTAYVDFFEPNASMTSWQPGSLIPATHYYFDIVALNGSATQQNTIGGDPFTFYMANGISNGADFNTQGTPEPMTLTLLGSGLVILFRRRRAA